MKKEEIEYLINEFGFKDKSDDNYNVYVKNKLDYEIVIAKHKESNEYELSLLCMMTYKNIALNNNCILEDVIALLHIIR